MKKREMREKSKIEEITREVARRNDAEVVDFTYNRQGKRCFIKIVVCGLKPDFNVNIQTITEITKEIKRNSEFDGIVPEDYRLEVTSPGSDYPLKNFKDFTRSKGQKVRLRHDNLEVKTPITGEIVEVIEDGIYLSTSQGKVFFSYEQIDFGKVIY